MCLAAGRARVEVTLREMKPEKKTPAHETAYFAELCCSNSLRAAGLENAVGLLKEELRRLGSDYPLRRTQPPSRRAARWPSTRHGFARMVTSRCKATRTSPSSPAR